jgi:hypothetical protein
MVLHGVLFVMVSVGPQMVYTEAVPGETAIGA